MIPGWLPGAAGADLPHDLVDAPIPVPHRAYYRDRTPITIPVPGAGRAIVRQLDANEVEIEAGLNAEGQPALELAIVKTQVFHGLVVDTVGLDFRWRACGERPGTEWGACGERPATEWECC